MNFQPPRGEQPPPRGLALYEQRSSELRTVIAGALASLADAILRALGLALPTDVVYALPAVIGFIPLLTTHQQVVRTRREQRQEQEVEQNREDRRGDGKEAVKPLRGGEDLGESVQHRPAETTTIMAGALSTVILASLRARGWTVDREVASALPALVGAVPMATTWLIDPRIRSARGEAETRMLRAEVLPLREQLARAEAERSLLRDQLGPSREHAAELEAENRLLREELRRRGFERE